MSSGSKTSGRWSLHHTQLGSLRTPKTKGETEMKQFMRVMAAGLSICALAMVFSGLTPDTASADDIDFLQMVNVITLATIRANAISVPMDIAVVDRGGRLKGFGRMDGAWIGSIDIAQAKAFTATAFCNYNANPICVN